MICIRRCPAIGFASHKADLPHLGRERERYGDLPRLTNVFFFSDLRKLLILSLSEKRSSRSKTKKERTFNGQFGSFRRATLEASFRSFLPQPLFLNVPPVVLLALASGCVRPAAALRDMAAHCTARLMPEVPRYRDAPSARGGTSASAFFYTGF